MKPWLRLTTVRLLIGIAIAGALALVLLWWPIHKARNLTLQQLELTNQALETTKNAQSTLSSLPALAEVKTQEIGAIKNYALAAKSAADSFSKLTLRRPKSLKPLIGLSSVRGAHIISDVNDAISYIKDHQAYKNARDTSAATYELLVYHANVSDALVNVLEYNPVDDMANFTPGSEDTNNRLQKAQDGLQKTDRQLQDADARYKKDKTIDEVLAIVSMLRQARYTLSQDNDVHAWVVAVNKAQMLIVKNRTDFWAASTKSAIADLSNQQTSLELTRRLWQTIADTYHLKTAN